MKQNRRSVLFLIGPTGTGKSELAIRLATALKGEIVSCDSMLVYRGMDIGTAKPPQSLRRRIPHHVMDLVRPTQSFSVREYCQAALAAIQDICERGKIPIVAGGSGLYIEALLDGLAPHEKINPSLRNRLRREVKEKGLAILYERLKAIDPDRAREILPRDERRILRALEIYESLGLKPSDWRKNRIGLGQLGFHWLMVGLERDRTELYNLINMRVDAMMAQGFLEEVKKLSKKRLSLTARQAIGYRELTDFLKGRKCIEEAVEETKKRSRHLAKKQIIWFRHEKRILWMKVRGHSHLTDGKKAILKRWREFCDQAFSGARKKEHG